MLVLLVVEPRLFGGGTEKLLWEGNIWDKLPEEMDILPLLVKGFMDRLKDASRTSHPFDTSKDIDISQTSRTMAAATFFGGSAFKEEALERLGGSIIQK